MDTLKNTNHIRESHGVEIETSRVVLISHAYSFPPADPLRMYEAVIPTTSANRYAYGAPQEGQLGANLPMHTSTEIEKGP